MDGRRKGSQSSRSPAITSAGHVTETNHMASGPKKSCFLTAQSRRGSPISRVNQFDVLQQHSCKSQCRTAENFLIFSHSCANVETFKAKETPIWDWLDLSWCVAGIQAAGVESEEEVAGRQLARKVSQYRAQAAGPDPSAGSSQCQCHQGAATHLRGSRAGGNPSVAEIQR